jgi:hypothetical protein
VSANLPGGDHRIVIGDLIAAAVQGGRSLLDMNAEYGDFAPMAC